MVNWKNIEKLDARVTRLVEGVVSDIVADIVAQQQAASEKEGLKKCLNDRLNEVADEEELGNSCCGGTGLGGCSPACGMTGWDAFPVDRCSPGKCDFDAVAPSEDKCCGRPEDCTADCVKAAKRVQPGDVVRLISGGPEMTVLRETEDGRLTCGYFCNCVLQRVSLDSRGLKVIKRNRFA